MGSEVAVSLLSVSTDAKTVKGEKQGYLTGILYLAPHTIAGVGNLCPNATAGCMAACLYTAGRGVFNNVQAARIAKTKRFHADLPAFMAELVKDIAALVRKARRAGMTPVVRLNGTSDLPWENIVSAVSTVRFGTLMQLFPDVQFYDYTKSEKRALAHARGQIPANYHLTFSRSECNEAECNRLLAAGGNVAVVFNTKRGAALPATWNAFPVIDGDTSDLRFLDALPSYRANRDGWMEGNHGLVVGLRAKGPARRDRSGFVVSETNADLSDLHPTQA
jgi:hypothetical protein